MAKMKRFLTTGQAAELCSVTPDTVLKWIRSGRLAAARTWRYDRYLENHNLCDLPPDAVEQMIEDQRRYRLQSSESQMP